MYVYNEKSRWNFFLPQGVSSCRHCLKFPSFVLAALSVSQEDILMQYNDDPIIVCTLKIITAKERIIEDAQKWDIIHGSF